MLLFLFDGKLLGRHLSQSVVKFESFQESNFMAECSSYQWSILEAFKNPQLKFQELQDCGFKQSRTSRNPSFDQDRFPRIL